MHRWSQCLDRVHVPSAPFGLPYVYTLTFLCEGGSIYFPITRVLLRRSILHQSVAVVLGLLGCGLGSLESPWGSFWRPLGSVGGLAQRRIGTDAPYIQRRIGTNAPYIQGNEHRYSFAAPPQTSNDAKMDRYWRPIHTLSVRTHHI